MQVLNVDGTRFLLKEQLQSSFLITTVDYNKSEPHQYILLLGYLPVTSFLTCLT
jgi:hypothetical protein